MVRDRQVNSSVSMVRGLTDDNYPDLKGEDYWRGQLLIHNPVAAMAQLFYTVDWRIQTIHLNY